MGVPLKHTQFFLNKLARPGLTLCGGRVVQIGQLTNLFASAYQGKCTCNAGYFADNGKCLTRKSEGEACTAYGQCTDNAECSSRTGGVCRCDLGYYPDAGECLRIKDVSQPCARETRSGLSVTEMTSSVCARARARACVYVCVCVVCVCVCVCV